MSKQGYEFNQYLSFLDLEKLDDWYEAWNGQNKELFDEILYKHGADIKYGWELKKCLHRPRTPPKMVYDDYVIRFKERTDKEWEPYREVEDIAREHDSSIVRYGMKMSLNSTSDLSEIIEDELCINVRLLELNKEIKELF